MKIFLSDRSVPDLPTALDLIADAWYLHQAEVVAIDVAQLPPEFFELRSGFAGEVTQKFAQYEMRLAVVGDVSAYEAASKPFRDWVREYQRGTQLWFVPDLETLQQRLDSRYGGSDHAGGAAPGRTADPTAELD